MKKINPNGVAALSKDVRHLTDFVDGLENGFMLRSNLDELEQTIQLLQSDNTDEFFDISTRNKKYGRVDALNGPVLLEKCVSLSPSYSPSLAILAWSGKSYMRTFVSRDSSLSLTMN